MAGIVIRESIHHGEFRKEREITLPDLSDDSINELLATSAYFYSGRLPYNRWVARLQSDLAATGHGSHGWSRFDVIPLPIEHNGEIGRDPEIIAHHVSPAGRQVTEVRVTNGDNERVVWHVQDRWL